MNWPTTIDDAVTVVINTLTPDQRNDIRNIPKDELISLHHSVGQWIRNEFGLWQGNFKLLEACEVLPFDADEASSIIIEKVWEELKK